MEEIVGMAVGMALKKAKAGEYRAVGCFAATPAWWGGAHCAAHAKEAFVSSHTGGVFAGSGMGGSSE
jgi:hypothetical protein